MQQKADTVSYLPAQGRWLELCANEVDNMGTASGLGDYDLLLKALKFFLRWVEAVILPPHELDGDKRRVIQESFVDAAKAANAQDPILRRTRVMLILLVHAYCNAVWLNAPVNMEALCWRSWAFWRRGYKSSIAVSQNLWRSVRQPASGSAPACAAKQSDMCLGRQNARKGKCAQLHECMAI